MKILRQRDVMSRTGYSAMTLWRREAAGTFPRRVHLGPNSVGWVAEEIDAWIEARIAERDSKLKKEHDAAAENSTDLGRTSNEQ